MARNQGRVGAAGGPAGIRKFLAGLPAHGLTRLLDAGDVACEGDLLEDAQERLGLRLAELMEQGARPVVLGGGHEIAWGSFQGLARWLRARGDAGPVLVLNLDAHFDLRTGRPGSLGHAVRPQIARDCEARGQSLQYACLGVSRLANTPALYARAAEIGAFWVEDRDTARNATWRARLADVDALAGSCAAHVCLTMGPGRALPAARSLPGVSWRRRPTAWRAGGGRGDRAASQRAGAQAAPGRHGGIQPRLRRSTAVAPARRPPGWPGS